jgi:hypothetical protein
MDLLKRHSISLGLGKKERSLKPNISKSPAQDAFRPAKLAFVVESPPLVSFNAPSQSSGALFSGELRLTVLEKSVVFESIVVELISCVSVKKPVAPNCPQCTSVKTTLRKWVFANEPLTLEKGEHKFPVSHLFEGKAPATTHAYLAMLDYEFAAVATTATGETLKFAQTVELNRAIPPGLDKQSVRVFPPTNITANITLNPTVHQIGEFPVVMRMNGMTTRQKDAQVRWRLRRLNWRIEEHQKVFSPACEKHRAKLSDGKAGILHEENRCIGEHEVNYNKNPWKSDPSAGSVETEFVCSVNASKKPVCDVKSDAMSVTHVLVLELVVAEEWAQNKRPGHISPTGAARILRTQFPLLLTQHAGLGIAWDEEAPPMYEDVPESPPGYQNNTHVEDFDIRELDGSLEDLHLGEPHDHAGAVGSSSTVTGWPRSFGELTARSSTPILDRPPSFNEAVGDPRRSLSATSAHLTNGSAPRFSVDDLLQEPPELRRPRLQGTVEETT